MFFLLIFLFLMADWARTRFARLNIDSILLFRLKCLELRGICFDKHVWIADKSRRSDREKELAKLKAALAAGHEASISYLDSLEPTAANVTQLAAEAKAKYGDTLSFEVTKPKAKKSARKRKA